MADIKFNPFTGNFDFVGAGSTPVPTYEMVISSLAAWGSASAGLYTIIIPASTHGKGSKPLVQCLETTGLTFTLISIASNINTNGDVTIEVMETPDNRFLGKILIGD